MNNGVFTLNVNKFVNKTEEKFQELNVQIFGIMEVTILTTLFIFGDRADLFSVCCNAMCYIFVLALLAVYPCCP